VLLKNEEYMLVMKWQDNMETKESSPKFYQDKLCHICLMVPCQGAEQPCMTQRHQCRLLRSVIYSWVGVLADHFPWQQS